MTKRVYIPQAVDDAAVRFLNGQGYQIHQGDGLDREQILKDLCQSDAILLRTITLDADLLQAAAGRLKVIAKHGVGVDNIDLVAARRWGIRVTNAPLSNAGAVAEHALAMILALAKNLVVCDQAFRRSGDFNLRYSWRNADLATKTIGIIGFGRIGRLLARKASLGLDMRVIAFDSVWSDDAPAYVLRAGSLDELLEESDYISIHVPLTDSTRHMINRCSFGKMKKTACFINVARGELVAEQDLVEALRSGQIAGAGLDVFETEPTGPELAFLKMNSVVLSPHNAAFTDHALQRMAMDAAQGIHEVLSGRQPTWPII